MLRRLFSARSSNPRSGGFTLSEVLVGLSIMSVVIVSVGAGLVFVTKALTDHQARTQAQQSVRAAVEALTREMRLAGACMPVATQPPIASNFQPITGVHPGTTDSITVTSNPRCAGPATVSADCNACSIINVDNTTNFTAGMWAFIYNSSNQTSPPGPYGQYFLVQSVAAGGPGAITVSPTTPLAALYPQLNSQTNQNASSVYGADQRAFAISSTCSGCNGIPTLTLQLLGAAQVPLVKGIDQMNITYTLNRVYNAATCDAQTGGTLSLCVVDLPTQGKSLGTDWQLVRAMSFTLDAQSPAPVRASGSADGFLHLSETFEVSPRNFVFQQTQRVKWTPY
jgi:prepilin-type N-terminal cleavage/methylation domain-containing protein